MALVSCKNVTVKYGSYTAVSGVSFDLHEGEYLCIVGANGSGKSTLVKSILGLEKPSEGEILCQKKGTGYLSQQSSVHRDFPATVEEVVLSGVLAARKGLSKYNPFYTKSERQLASKKISELGIEKIRSKSFQELSGGQMQRVLLARALCASDNLLVLDEPVNGLDPVVTDELYALVRKLNREDKVAIIMVSHDIHRAVLNATHILHMDGSPLFYGTSQDYQQTPYFNTMSEVETCSTHACNHCGSDCKASHIYKSRIVFKASNPLLKETVYIEKYPDSYDPETDTGDITATEGDR